jgi:hypothetical protein
LPVNPTSIGALRAAIEGLSDKAALLPDWAEGQPPEDSEYGIEVYGFEKGADGGGPFLKLKVGLYDLYEDTEDAVDLGPIPVHKFEFAAAYMARAFVDGYLLTNPVTDLLSKEPAYEHDTKRWIVSIRSHLPAFLGMKSDAEGNIWHRAK